MQISKKNYDRLVKENKRDVDYLTEKGFVPNEKVFIPQMFPFLMYLDITQKAQRNLTSQKKPVPIYTAY